MKVCTPVPERYREFTLNMGVTKDRQYNKEYLSLIYDLVVGGGYFGWSVCHICITIDEGTETNFYTRHFKRVFDGCLYVLKRENSKGSFNENAFDVEDSKGEHLHLFVIFPGGSRSVSSFSKMLKDLIRRVNKNKYRSKRIRNFNIVNSRVKSWVAPEYLEKYDVWFDSLEERKKSTKVKREVVLGEANVGKVFRWMSYLAKRETATNNTQKPLLVKDLTSS